MGRAAKLQHRASRAATWVAALRLVVGLLLALQAGLSLADEPGTSPLTPPARAVQRRSLITSVSEMQRGSSLDGDVYFVGFAGFGEQKVFRKEAELARQVIGARFAIGSRSLLLVNDIHDRRTYPLATFENLRTAVHAIGRRMHRDRDVLVLMLTSHGNDTDGIAITNGKLPEDALSPGDVRRILDESRIRWRIVIVSACYSGIFIPELKNAATLVMTAADSRHSSFGCDDTRDLTYFGEALLRDALPHACSLPAAYSAMARSIRQRETDEGEIHSNPQLFVGARLRSRLLRLDAAAGRSCSTHP